MWDLNSYFDFNHGKNDVFVKSLAELLCDDKIRYFVPEVNSDSRDLQSIIRDMENQGFNFIRYEFSS